MSSPDDALSPELLEALRRLAKAPVLLAAFDFDGTLAPFTVDPQDSRALPESQEALDRLAAMERTHVGIISGRDLGFLRSVVDKDRTKLLSGSHGAELDLHPLGPDAGDTAIRLSGEQLVALDRAVDAVREVVDRYPGAKAELKPAGVCLHTRPMEDQSLSDQALAEMLGRFEALDGLRITPGQQVMECSVLSATKGEGVEALIRATGADAALFVGDDVTDEAGFAAVQALGGWGIKVGEGPTMARHRCMTPAALRGWLSSARTQGEREP